MATKPIWLSPADREPWDDFVRSHPFGCLCHLSAWQDVLESSFRHMRAHVCVLRDEATGAITAGLPLYLVRSRLLGNRLVSVPFASLCDPLIATSEDFAVMLPAVLGLLKQTHARYLEVRTWRSSPLVGKHDLRASESYKHHSITLDRPAGQIWRTFSRTAVRQTISKAQRRGLHVVDATGETDLAQFYRLLVETRRRLSLPPIPYRLFLSLWHTFRPTGHLSLLMACDGDRPVAALLCLKWPRAFALEYVGYTLGPRSRGAVPCLYWEALQRAESEGCELFSFGRTYRGNLGLRESKERWHADEEDLCTFFHPPTTHKDAEDRNASLPYRLIRGAARHAPDPLYRLLGEFCYRHLG